MHLLIVRRFNQISEALANVWQKPSCDCTRNVEFGGFFDFLTKFCKVIIFENDNNPNRMIRTHLFCVLGIFMFSGARSSALNAKPEEAPLAVGLHFLATHRRSAFSRSSFIDFLDPIWRRSNKVAHTQGCPHYRPPLNFDAFRLLFSPLPKAHSFHPKCLARALLRVCE